jgi:hypothetical protein
MFENPFGSNLQDLQTNYMQQMQVMQQMQQQKQASMPVLEEINKAVSAMNAEEQSMMAESQDYQFAKQTYEAGFMSFLGSKFASEYVSTPDGKIAANNLLNIIKQQKEKVSEGLRAKQQKIDKLLNLLENDPELQKKYEEMLASK